MALSCAPAGVPTDPGLSPHAWVQVGGGDDHFEPLADGDPLVMVHGPQGGWHVLGSVRDGGLDAVVEIRFRVWAEEHGGALISDNRYRVQQVPDPEQPGAYAYPGMYGYLWVDELAQGELDTPPELLAWQELRLRMDLVDERGNATTGQLRVIAEPDPDDLDMVP